MTAPSVPPSAPPRVAPSPWGRWARAAGWLALGVLGGWLWSRTDFAAPASGLSGLCRTCALADDCDQIECRRFLPPDRPPPAEPP